MANHPNRSRTSSQNYLLDVSYLTSRNSKSLSSYRVALLPTDLDLAEFAQQGETINDRVLYRGVFGSKHAAISALLNFVTAACNVVEVTPWGSEPYIALDDVGPVRRREQADTRLLARRTADGTWMAS